ncbi:MAG: carboxylesterase family protein [Negativicutes bacterium]
MKTIRVLAFCGILLALLAAVANAAVITAPCGQISGIMADNGANAWLGIPYAHETSGNYRFRPPQPVADFIGIYNADKYSPACLQVINPEFKLVDTISENSLTLNIWSPATTNSELRIQNSGLAQNLPVCVFIHGGGYTIGSSAQPLYNGANLAKNGNIIFVTINYRLGAEGFLYLNEVDESFAGSGNIGLQDQVAALKWVQRNIAAFGGDPAQVTIMGESAGAGSVACLMVAPAAKGLFNKAIIESGGFQLTKDKSDAALVTKKFMKYANCKNIAELQKLSVEQFLTAQAVLMKEYGWLANETLFAPVRGDVLIPENPLVSLQNGAARNISLLVGTNQDEMGLFKRFVPLKPLMNMTTYRLFVPDDAVTLVGKIDYQVQQFYQTTYPQLSGIDLLFKAVDDVFFNVNAYRLADAQSYNGNVYMYRFIWSGEYGAIHGLELPAVFGNAMPDAKVYFGNVPLDPLVTKLIQPAWLAFITTGNASNTPATGLWAQYETIHRPMLQLSTTAKLRCDIDSAARLFWYNR